MIGSFSRTFVALLALALFAGAFAQDDNLVIGWSGAVTGPTSDAGQFVIQGSKTIAATSRTRICYQASPSPA